MAMTSRHEDVGRAAGYGGTRMAGKVEAIGGFRWEALARRPFATRYYNADLQ
jgi:hypothetical protein